MASAGLPFSSSSAAISLRSRVAPGTSPISTRALAATMRLSKSAGSSDPSRMRACATPRLSPRPCRRVDDLREIRARVGQQAEAAGDLGRLQERVLVVRAAA